jgi:hypothetical protein
MSTWQVWRIPEHVAKHRVELSVSASCVRGEDTHTHTHTHTHRERERGTADDFGGPVLSLGKVDVRSAHLVKARGLDQGPSVAVGTMHHLDHHHKPHVLEDTITIMPRSR